MDEVFTDIRSFKMMEGEPKEVDVIEVSDNLSHFDQLPIDRAGFQSMLQEDEQGTSSR
jgi:hypothetical protein